MSIELKVNKSNTLFSVNKSFDHIQSFPSKSLLLTLIHMSNFGAT